MSLINPQLPKQYKNGKVLFEQNLDAWRLAAEQAFATVNLNLTQLRKDCFLANYDFNNNGVAVLPKSLQEQINDLTTGATPISGTLSATWTINSGGNSLILSSAGLTADRTFTFPDLDGQVVTINATQTLTNKTLTSPTINAPTITNAIMSGVTVFDAGSALLPSITFTGDLNTGVYSPGADQLATTLGGIQNFLWTTTYAFSVNPFYLPDGVVGAPGLAFNSNTDLGIFRNAANSFTLVTGGSSALTLSNSSVLVQTNRVLLIQAGTVANTGLGFDGDVNTGLISGGADNFSLVTGGSTALTVNNTDVIVQTNRNLQIQAGAVGTPSLYTAGDTNTGLYFPAADQVGVATGGSLALLISNDLVQAGTSRQILAWGGAGATPGYSFSTDQDSGFSTAGAGNFALFVDSNIQLSFHDGYTEVETSIRVPSNDPPTNNAEVNVNSLAKAWGKINSDGTSTTNYNVSGTSFNGGTVTYTVTIDTDFLASSYPVITGMDWDGVSDMKQPVITSKAAGSFDVQLVDDDRTVGTVYDWYFACYSNLV